MWKAGMRKPFCTLVVGVATAIAGAVFVAACSDSPTSPTTSSVVIRSIEILGPDSVPPGESHQFTVIAHNADGGSEDVTGDAAWSVTDQLPSDGVLSVSASGVATGNERGEAILRAAVGSRGAAKSLLILPDGTFKVFGTVSDEGFPVVAARVEVISGPSAGLLTTTREGGLYDLYGVTGDTQLQVSKDGYVTAIRRAVFTDHATVDFELAPSAPRPDWSGTYTLTITAAPSCSGLLAAEFGTRSYIAEARQTGANLEVTLSGASFLVSGNLGDRFSGRVEPDGVTFSLWPYDNYYYYGGLYHGSVVERVAPTLFYSPSGSVDAEATPTGLSGTLDGRIAILEGADVSPLRRLTSCPSADHEFALTR